MPEFNNGWFHNRSSSNLTELLTVKKLVDESKKIDYLGLRWGAGRDGNELLFKFANVGGVQPSTMQTKIRAMIRFGFLIDKKESPLEWSKMGQLWNDLHTIGNHTAAKKIYQLTLTTSLALFSFNENANEFIENPSEGILPLKYLLNNLDSNNEIEIANLKEIIDGRSQRTGENLSYWKSDLINSGLFTTFGTKLKLNDGFAELIEDIKSFSPSSELTIEQWKEIKNDPLNLSSPFEESLLKIFNRISEETELIQSIVTTPLLEIISEQQEIILPEIDILSNETRFITNSKRVRNQTWSLRIKKKYDYSCAVPECDVVGKLFLEAAHIKPDSAQENEIPHRAHLLNGICLCKHCHVAFDYGYFSLTDDSKIILSNRISELSDQHIKNIISNSSGQQIKNRIDSKLPLRDFIEYHRTTRLLN